MRAGSRACGQWKRWGHMKYLANVDSAKPISRIGLGTWQFGSREWGYGEQYNSRDADQIVARAAEVGINLFDTAEIYGFGKSETIVGGRWPRRLVKGLRRDQDCPLSRRPVGATAGACQRPTPGDRHDRPVPGPSAQSVRARRHDDGGMRPAGLGVVRHVGVSNYSFGRWKARNGRSVDPS